MGIQRIVILGGGTVGMFLLMLLRRKSFPEIKVWKMAVISVLLTIAGVAGAMLMHFIEQGSFGGTSFFGAILFIPVLILPALLLRVRYSELADLCAPAECLMLAFMKVDCLLVGCCEGKYLPSLDCQFPSQIVEMIVILLGMLLFLQFERKGKFRGNLYACYLIFYGITRFILNWFRYGIEPFALGLPAGNFWSIIAIIFGIAWFIVMKKFCSRTNK